jgi:hypothetical protein
MKSIFDFMQTASKHATGEDIVKMARTLYHKYLDEEYGKTLTAEVNPVTDLHVGDNVRIQAVAMYGGEHAAVTIKGLKGKVLNLTDRVVSESLYNIAAGIWGNSETLWKDAQGFPIAIMGIELIGSPIDDDHDRAYSLKVVPVNNFID